MRKSAGKERGLCAWWADFIAASLCVVLLHCGTVSGEELPELKPVDMSKLKPGDFADEELSLVYYLKHLHRLTNSIVDEGENRGFINIHVYRRRLYPLNVRVCDNVLSFAHFYTTDRPWNPYYGDAGLRKCIEASLEYWCRIYGSRPLMTSKFMGETLVRIAEAKDRTPVDDTIYEKAVETHRHLLLKMLGSEKQFLQWRRTTNPYSCVWGGAAALLKLKDDKQLESLFRRRLEESMQIYQSPAGYFYEKNGPDWIYDMVTHHSSLQMGWEYLNGTDLGEYFEQKLRRWYQWLSYNAVLEPDGTCFFLNRAVETRCRKAMLTRMLYSYAKAIEQSWAFCLSEEEAAERYRRQRRRLEEKWPRLPDLRVGYFHAYSPYEFLHRGSRWYPTEAERAEAVSRLPYIAREKFIHQRVDGRVRAVFTYIRLPGYYAAFNSGVQVSKQQRLGLGLLWTRETGAVVQSQTDSTVAAWGTKADKSGNVYEAGDVEAKFFLDGKEYLPQIGNRNLSVGDKLPKIVYDLGQRGRKVVRFAEDFVEVEVKHGGDFWEFIPILRADGESLKIAGKRAELNNRGGKFFVEWTGAEGAELLDTEFEGDRTVLEEVEGPAFLYRIPWPSPGRSHKDVITVRLRGTGGLKYRMFFGE